MSERDLVQGDVSLPELHRPRFIVSRQQAAGLVVFGYAAVVSSASLLLGLVEYTQGYDDHRNIDAALLFAAVMAIPFGLALYGATHRTRLPELNASSK